MYNTSYIDKVLYEQPLDLDPDYKGEIMREIYMYGKLVRVEPSDITFKEYDWVQLQRYLDSGISVEVGIMEDWGYTSDPVTQKDIDDREIAGISGSDWGTPAVLIDGSYIPCFVEKPIKEIK